MKRETPACPRCVGNALQETGSGITADGSYVQWECPLCRGRWNDFGFVPSVLIVERAPMVVTEPMSYEG